MSARSRLRLRRSAIALLIAGLLMCLAMAAPVLNLLDNQPLRSFPGPRPKADIAAVYVSGDVGLRYGIGPKVAPVLAEHGIPVVGVSSIVSFATHRTRQEAEEIVLRAIATALRETGARQLVLIGQSFGADIVATVLPDLPPTVRERIVASVLIVPSPEAYFRADPTGIAYHGTPDAMPTAGLRRMTSPPLICIYGVEESESMCPQLDATRTRVVGLPGGHFLKGNDALLTATILRELRQAVPGIGGDHVS